MLYSTTLYSSSYIYLIFFRSKPLYVPQDGFNLEIGTPILCCKKKEWSAPRSKVEQMASPSRAKNKIMGPIFLWRLIRIWTKATRFFQVLSKDFLFKIKDYFSFFGFLGLAGVFLARFKSSSSYPKQRVHRLQQPIGSL